MLFGLFAWPVLFAIYLLFAGQLSSSEIIAGLPASALLAIFVVIHHRAELRGMSLRGPWLRLLTSPISALIPDALRVGRVLVTALWKRPLGVIARQPFEHGGETPDAAGRRGLVTLAISVAPNGYVIDLPTGEDVLLVHRLSAVAAAPDRSWPL